MISELFKMAMRSFQNGESADEYERRIEIESSTSETQRKILSHNLELYCKQMFASHAKWKAYDAFQRKGFRVAPEQCLVTLDGEEVEHFIAVDTATGKGWRYKKNDKGRFVIDRENNCLVEEVVYGSFRISPRKLFPC